MLYLIIIIFILINLMIFFSFFKNPKQKIADKSYDCGIVCGYPANDDGSPSKIMASRVEAGVYLYQQGKIKKLILSGGAVKNQYVEAKVMQEYAVTLGVLLEDTIVEAKSRSTYHNLMYCKEIVAEMGFKDCLVITNSWHLRKADHYARKFKYHYVMYKAKKPADYSLIKVICLHIYTNLNMYINLFKGLY